jgi:hypothetical protein
VLAPLRGAPGRPRKGVTEKICAEWAAMKTGNVETPTPEQLDKIGKKFHPQEYRLNPKDCITTDGNGHYLIDGSYFRRYKYYRASQ